MSQVQAINQITGTRPSARRGYKEISLLSIIARPNQEHKFPNDCMCCSIVDANNEFDLITKGFIFGQNRAFTGTGSTSTNS
jgi:hypothetical protein